ncbi:granzyme B-like, partial [Pseudorasbora parva]|uniref:granzyme B-like n=1 Tax=Pseudorasbora parva TaxID=51549 RepID=UPI00351F50BF
IIIIIIIIIIIVIIIVIILISLLLLASLLPHLTFTARVNVGIVNGKEAEPHSRPYIVSLQKFGSHTCGGSLISDQFVLTAAHCWKARDIITVVVGAHDLRNSKASDRYTVMSYIPHPEYVGRPNPIRNDIMLLRLENPVELNSNVSLIPLPNEGEEVGTDAVCSVAGWGRLSTFGHGSSVLMEADTTTMAQTECERSWGFRYFDVGQMLCAHGGGGSCQGDSGGPLVCGNTTVGVTSFGSSRQCNSAWIPNVYTKISTYIQWIRQEMGNIY